MKANMDGSIRRTLVDNLQQPEGVTIDIKDKRSVALCFVVLQILWWGIHNACAFWPGFTIVNLGGIHNWHLRVHINCESSPQTSVYN